MNRWPFNKIRDRAIKKTVKYLRYGAENSRYITIGCVEKVSKTNIFLLYFIGYIEDLIMVGWSFISWKRNKNNQFRMCGSVISKIVTLALIDNCGSVFLIRVGSVL